MKTEISRQLEEALRKHLRSVKLGSDLCRGALGMRREGHSLADLVVAACCDLIDGCPTPADDDEFSAELGGIRELVDSALQTAMDAGRGEMS